MLVAVWRTKLFSFNFHQKIDSAYVILYDQLFTVAPNKKYCLNWQSYNSM